MLEVVGIASLLPRRRKDATAPQFLWEVKSPEVIIFSSASLSQNGHVSLRTPTLRFVVSEAHTPGRLDSSHAVMPPSLASEGCGFVSKAKTWEDYSAWLLGEN